MLANTKVNITKIQLLDCAPPLVMTHTEIDTMIRLMRTAFDKTLTDVKKLGLV